jgi:hypothetical protein
MDYKPKIKNYDSQSLMLINAKGRLRRLYTPFRVQTIQPVGIIKSHSIVYVTAVIQDEQAKLLYRILNSWIPYHQFQLITLY